MLDSNLIKFVEPIGAGQIVDRESLVALPVGYVQVSIENDNHELLVKVLGLSGMQSPTMDDELTSNSVIKTYIWQNGVVVAGEEIMETSDENQYRRISKFTSIRRRRMVGSSFRFRKQPTNNPDYVVDGILQICAYRASSGTMQRKTFLGTVHIALKCLTSAQSKVNSCIPGKEEWYKVFPKSTFLPGSPSDIAKTNCYISGLSEIEDGGDEIFLDGEDGEDTSTCSIVSTSSVVSFSQFRLQHTRRPSLFTSPGTLLRNPGKKSPRESPTNATVSRKAILKWLRMQKSVDEEKPSYQSNRRLTVSIEPPTLSKSAPPMNAPFLIGSPSSTSSRRSFGSSTESRIHQYRTSCSTFSSSTDIGYESSRSDCSTSDEEESRKVSRKSKLRLAFERTLSFRSSKEQRAARPSAPQDIPSPPAGNSSLTRPVTFTKSRGSFLRRGRRIPVTTAFTSLNEIVKSESINSFESVAGQQ